MRCKTNHCRGRVFPSGRSPFCSKCRTRRFKEAHPEAYAFGKLRSRARERGIEFGLTFEEYRDFGRSSGYFDGKGKTAKSLSIDRKDGNKGYTAANLRCVTLSMNTRLAHANMPDYIKQEMIEAERASRL